MFRKACSTALAAFALAVTVDPAAAVTRNWLNAGGGSADLSSNWNPSAVPAVADLLRFDLPNTFTVNFGSGADSVDTHQFYRGDVSCSFGADHGVRTGFHVAPLVAQVATARILSGDLRLGWSASVGAGASATGTLRIGGGSTNVSQNVVGASPAGPVMHIGGNGIAGGTGEVVVLNGGQLDLAYHLNVGRSAGGTGTLRVRGAGNGANGLRRSHVFADSSGADCHLGRDLGHGVLEVKDGGLFRVGRDLIMGEELGDVGEITIDGQNAIDSSNVRVKDDLWVAANSIAGAPGGSGTVTLDSLGVLVVDDSTVVGDPDGSAGLMTLKFGSRMSTKHLILRQPAGGSMDFQAGLLQVNGGTLSTSNGRLTIPGGTSNVVMPILELLNGAQATFNGTPADPPLTIGSNFYAQLNVKSGSRLVADGGSVTVQTGYLEIDGGGEVTSNRVGLLGPDGYGYLFLHGGARATFDGLDLGSGAIGGFGGVIMDGTTSVLNLTGPLNVGGSSLAGGNSGHVALGVGSVLNLLAPIDAGTIWPASVGANQLAVTGHVNMTGRLWVRDQLWMLNGYVVGGSVALRGNGFITGNGKVQSAILAGADTTVSISATGPLEIGRDEAGGDVLMRGTMSEGGYWLTVHDPDSAVVGNVIMTGGYLFLPAGGGVIETGKRVVGEGEIDGPLVNHGYLISQGAFGLRFGGTVYGTGQGAGGDLIRFLDGGGFEGSGTIDAKIQADAGSLIRATGELHLGKAGLSDALILKGRIEAGARPLHLTNNDTTIVDGQLVLDGSGVLVIGGIPPVIGANGRLEGRGSIGPGLVVNGAIAPGHSAGRLYVVGPVVFDQGTFEAELGNHATAEHDTLVVFGPVTLAGNLALRRLGSYAAAPGDSFQILDCESLAGVFTSVTLDGAPLAGQVEVHYATNGVWIVVPQTLDVPRDPPALAPVLALQLAPLASPGQRPGVELALPGSAGAVVRAYDITGREVGVLWEGELSPGRHRFELSGDRTSTGVYFVRAWIDDRDGRTVKTVRVVRVR